MSNFKSLGVPSHFVKALNEINILQPTEVQEKVIPYLLEFNGDLIVQSPTGTGKTIAFGLPLINRVNPKNKGVQALILTPSRELGIQISKHLFKLTKYLPDKVFVEAVYGGEHIIKQIEALKRPTHIIVATPGRLKDLCQRKDVDLSGVRTVVLDEADEMLSMGFKEEVDFLLKQTQSQRDTWMFSASMPADVLDLIRLHFKKGAERIRIEKNNLVNKNIEHRYILTSIEGKNDLILQFLRAKVGERGVIFCRTRAATQQLADNLKKSGYQAEALHGDMSQAQRDRVMKRFKEHSLQLLIATDVAARGIDVNDLTHVIHYSLPDDDAYYTHRSGRTARAGKKGISLSILTNRDMRKFDALEKRLKLKMTKISIPSAKDIASKRLFTWAENILNTPTDKNVDGKILTDVQMLLGSLSYEELVEKLVSIELNALNYSKTSKDLNANGKYERKSSGKKRERGNRDHKDKRKKADKKTDFKGDRFFINVGKMDDVTKRDLVEFIADTARIKKSDVGTVEIQKNCSFFEVNKKYSKKIANSFKGIYVDGRELRVNRDS